MLKQSKQVGILYHYTFLNTLLDILNSNVLVGRKNGYQYDAVCFTRDAALHAKPRTIVGSSRTVRLVIDGNKLSQHYKIIPRNDTQYTKDNTIKHISGQAQQACITSKITDITKYIIRIDIDEERSINYLLVNRFISNNTMIYNQYIDKIKEYNIPIKFMSLGSSQIFKQQQYNQSLIKISMLIQSVLRQAKQVGILYHYTNIYHLESIIQKNQLITSQWKYRDEFEFTTAKRLSLYNNSPSDIKSICFTRNKNFHNIIGFGAISVRFIIDGDKLSNNYKLIPIRDLANLGRNKLEVDQSQTICNKNIKNIKQYIIKIEIDPLVSIFYILLSMGVFDKQHEIHYYNYSIMQAEQQYQDIESVVKNSKIPYKLVSIPPFDVIGKRFNEKYKLFLKLYNNLKN